jgi:uncharacterized protein (TIGR02145 family)
MKKNTSKSVLLVAMIILSISTNYVLAQTKKAGKTATVEKYKSVKIGNQVWMIENLNVSTFRNGDLIPEEKGEESNFSPLMSNYKNHTYYNWATVNDPRGLAPKGWHIPSKNELNTVRDYMSSNENLSDDCYFELNGFIVHNRLSFEGEIGHYWSSDGYDQDSSYFMFMYKQDYTVKFMYHKAFLSIRCIKDDNILSEEANPVKTSSKTSTSVKQSTVKPSNTKSSSNVPEIRLTAVKKTGMDGYTDAERAERKKKMQDKERQGAEDQKKAQQKFDEERAQNNAKAPVVKARVRGKNEPANTRSK